MSNVDTSLSDLLKAAEENEATAKEEDPTTATSVSSNNANGKQKATEQKISTRRPGRGECHLFPLNISGVDLRRYR